MALTMSETLLAALIRLKVDDKAWIAHLDKCSKLHVLCLRSLSRCPEWSDANALVAKRFKKVAPYFDASKLSDSEKIDRWAALLDATCALLIRVSTWCVDFATSEWQEYTKCFETIWETITSLSSHPEDVIYGNELGAKIANKVW